MAKENMHSNIEFSELLKFLIRPLNELESRMYQRFAEVDKKVLDGFEAHSERFADDKRMLEELKLSCENMHKELELVSAQCNKQNASIHGIQNSINDLNQVRSKLAMHGDELDALKEELKQLPEMQANIKQSLNNDLKFERDLQLLSEKQKAAEDKQVAYSEGAKERLKSLEHELPLVKEGYLLKVAELQNQLANDRGAYDKQEQANQGKIKGLADRLERSHKEMLAKMNQDLRDQNEKHVKRGQRVDEVEAMYKQDKQSIMDKIEELAFLGKRCDLMDKRVENCFHLVKEIRVHLNL